MKNILRYTGLWMIAFLLFSCAKEEIDLEGKRVVEGIPTRVILNYDVPHNTVISRAAQESKYEYRVENMYVFVFKQDGSIHYRGFFEQGEFTVNNGDNATNGSLSFDTRTVANVKIVGIANLTTGTVATAYNVTEADMDAITSQSDLEAFVMKMNSESVYRGGIFMLTGTAVDKSGSETINIVGTESGSSTIDCTLKLKRTDAKVKFNVTSQAKNPNWKNFSFQPKEWVVRQVPAQSLLLPKTGTVDADGADCKYFATPRINFEEITRSEITGLFTGGSFVFYMPENKKSPKANIEATAGDYNAQYALREESDHIDEQPDGSYTNGAFTYANEYSTYVEMTGTLTYIDIDGKNVNAEVRYYVHLGSVDGVNDYNTERNVYYKYNVIVQGVNDIIVEVDEEREDRPGHEGDVVYSNAGVYELDSHYDRILIKIHKDNIVDDMTWGIRTPFGSGIYKNDNNYTGLEDHKWVKFAINRDYGETNPNLYVKYPGDQNYNDPQKKGPDNDQPSPYYTGYPDARLLDVDQLITRLKAEKANPSSTIFETDGNVAITVFVDENLYFDNPVTGQPGEQNRSLWKASVDKEDRMLHIIAAGSKYSPDGNSSIVNSLLTFKQKAIRTIFNTDKASLTTAWGLESVMETKRLAPGDVSQGTDRRNGRVNMLKWAENKKWNEVISVSDRYALNGDYNNAAYACMMRNRDLNGDNNIDANEVRWYLAAVDQLVDIYLGEYALDEASRLYPRNEADRGGSNNDMVNDHVRWHYTTSSYKSDDGGPWVLWAEEGAGLGSYGNSTGLMGGRYAYRCVRNLGLSLDNPDEIPSDLVSVESQGDGTYMVDMSNMSVKSRRTNYEIVQLPEHNERDADNRPYEKFQVLGAESDTPTPRTSAYYWDWQWNVSWDNGNAWQYYQTNNECPPGYRIPNQRELLIMSSRLPEGAWKTYVGRGPAGNERAWSKAIYLCQTAFSMDGINGYSKDRDGFHYNAQSRAFVLQNNQSEVGYVRCVRDIQQ